MTMFVLFCYTGSPYQSRSVEDKRLRSYNVNMSVHTYMVNIYIKVMERPHTNDLERLEPAVLLVNCQMNNNDTIVKDT